MPVLLTGNWVLVRLLSETNKRRAVWPRSLLGWVEEGRIEFWLAVSVPSSTAIPFHRARLQNEGIVQLQTVTWDCCWPWGHLGEPWSLLSGNLFSDALRSVVRGSLPSKVFHCLGV